MVLVVSVCASLARHTLTSHSGRLTAATNSLSSASFTVMRFSGSTRHPAHALPPNANIRVSSSSVARSACGYISLKFAGGR